MASTTETRSTAAHVVADINYFAPLGTPIPTCAWKKRYLGDSDEYTRPMTIRDIRQCQNVFNLNTHGFEFVKLTPKRRADSLSTEENIRLEYYPELEELAKSL
jgi:hypothetical protein